MLARGPAVALLALTLLGGCGYFRRVGECRRLARHVNGALDQISATHDAGAATSATYSDLAERYERLARDIDGFAKTDDALGRTLKEYAQSCQETARSLRTLAQALDKPDPIAAARVRREMGNFVRRDKVLTARIEGLCSEP